MGNHIFIDIEDFQNAYEERLKTYMSLKKESENNEIMIMHLGGIIVECYLKGLIVKKYNITKRKGINIWISQQQVNHILQFNQITNKQIIEQNLGIKNPGHNIIEAYKSLDEIKDLIASNEDLSKKFSYIYNPLRKEKSSFIDLRYSTKSDFNNINEEFVEWTEDFKEIIRWLNKNGKLVEVEI